MIISLSIEEEINFVGEIMDQSASPQKSFLIRDLLRDLIVNKNRENDESCDESGKFYKCKNSWKINLKFSRNSKVKKFFKNCF